MIRGAHTDHWEHAAQQRAVFWLLGFILLEIGCQVALLFEAIAPLRSVIRSASYGVSLALLVALPGRGRGHPARPWIVVALAIVALNLFHPTTNSWLSGLVQAGLMVAIVGPLFWVPRLYVTTRVLQTILLALWIFHAASSALGVLQTYYPGMFQPAVSAAILAQGELAGSLRIKLADGQEVWRPMGLSDMPGGAAVSGLYAILFGIGYLFRTTGSVARAVGLGTISLGWFCIYLSYTRSILVMTVVAVLVMGATYFRRGEVSRTVGLVLATLLVAVGTLTWAVSVGGSGVSNRVFTLVEDRFDTVYYTNRGKFLEYTLLEFLPQYPFGAGLGRWGMTYIYFGDWNNASAPPFHVEIQLTAWLADGGFPLAVAYGGAVLLTCWWTWKVANRVQAGDLANWAVLILGYDIGALAMTFNYALFIGQAGLEFWFLNACLATVVFREAALARRRALQARGAARGRPLAAGVGAGE
jgi:hypothetical protein